MRYEFFSLMLTQMKCRISHRTFIAKAYKDSFDCESNIFSFWIRLKFSKRRLARNLKCMRYCRILKAVHRYPKLRANVLAAFDSVYR